MSDSILKEIEQQQTPRADGGFLMSDDKVTKAQRKVALQFLMDLGKNLFGGKLSRTSIKLNYDVCTEKSQLQMCSEHLLNPVLFQKLKVTKNKLNLLLQYFFQSLVNSISDQHKPFNPMIGETFQNEVEGYQIFAEQIINHPPTSLYVIKDSIIEIGGSCALDAQVFMNHVDVVREGFNQLILDDVRFGFTFPTFRTYGLFFGSRWGCFIGKSLLCFSNILSMADLIEQPECKSQFIIKFGGQFRDSVSGEIFGKQLSGRLGQVIWLDDDEVYHYVVQQMDFKTKQSKVFSDSRKRQDVISFTQMKIDTANILKVEKEEQQRHDRKLRS